jgi:3-keto-5-aminohexanoate cleavage enzyme
MTTLNPCTMSFGTGEFRNSPADVEGLARRMQELEVKPELEIYDTGRLDECLRLRDKELVTGRLQFNIVIGVTGGMAATPENLITMVGRLPYDAIWRVIAIGRRNLDLAAIGIALGGNARAGLEDTLRISKHQLADGNNPLVERAAKLAVDLDRGIATTADAAETLLRSVSV